MVVLDACMGDDVMRLKEMKVTVDSFSPDQKIRWVKRDMYI